jgi:hypothetical protein
MRIDTSLFSAERGDVSMFIISRKNIQKWPPMGRGLFLEKSFFCDLSIDGAGTKLFSMFTK